MAEFLDKICEKLYLKALDEYPPAQDIGKKLHVKPSYIGLGVLVLLGLLVIFEYGATWIVFLAGFIYPTYASYKAIESPGEDDDTQWLTYWVIFSLIHVFDRVLSYIFTSIPFHNLVKFIFIVFLYHPRVQGARLIYHKAIQPILRKYEKHIDHHLDNLGKAAKDKYESSKPMVDKITAAAKDEAMRQAVDYAVHSHTKNE